MEGLNQVLIMGPLEWGDFIGVNDHLAGGCSQEFSDVVDPAVFKKGEGDVRMLEDGEAYPCMGLEVRKFCEDEGGNGCVCS